MGTSHVLKINLPTAVYKSASQAAAEQGVSLEQLAREAIAARSARPSALDLAAAYETLADDAEATDVEIFLEAQAEALLNE